MSKVKILKFEKDGCVPCKFVSEYLGSKNIQIDEVVNPFDNPEMAQKYRVRSVPKTILLNTESNEIVTEFNGADINNLNSFIEKYNSLV